MIDKNPAYGVKLPKSEIIKVRFLHQDEIQRLFKVIKENEHYDFLDIVKSYLNTGARRIELLHPLFTWENVDFKEKKILINGKGARKIYIPMNETFLNILKRRNNDNLKSPFSFKPDYVTHKIAEYYKKANIEKANLHSLRKTFGSTLLQNKISDLFTVSKLLGHTTVTTTEKYYVDLIDDNYRDSVEGLDNIF